MRIVEVNFDLTNPNQKPNIEVYKIYTETEINFIATYRDEFGCGRRFYKADMNSVKCHGLLKYGYSFKVDIDDYDEIYNHVLTQNAITEIKNVLQDEIEYYKRQIDGIVAYYNKCKEL